MRKISPPPGFFFFLHSRVLRLYFVRTCVFVLTVLHFAFLSLLTKHNTNIHASGGFRTRNPSRRPTPQTARPPGSDFLSLSVFALYLFFFVLIVLALPFVLTVNTHNSNIHAPSGIRTRNPSKRSAADTRLRPLGYWDRHSIPGPSSRYTD